MTYFTSAFMTLNKNDYVKGFIVAIITGVLNFIYPIITAHTLPTFSDTFYVAGIAGVGYLIKNLFTVKATVTPSAS